MQYQTSIECRKYFYVVDESLAKQVSLLAIELQLCIRQPEKALTLINYLENNLMYGGSIPLKGLDKMGKEKKVSSQFNCFLSDIYSILFNHLFLQSYYKLIFIRVPIRS